MCGHVGQELHNLPLEWFDDGVSVSQAAGLAVCNRRAEVDRLRTQPESLLPFAVRVGEDRKAQLRQAMINELRPRATAVTLVVA